MQKAKIISQSSCQYAVISTNVHVWLRCPWWLRGLLVVIMSECWLMWVRSGVGSWRVNAGRCGSGHVWGLDEWVLADVGQVRCGVMMSECWLMWVRSGVGSWWVNSGCCRLVTRSAAVEHDFLTTAWMTWMRNWFQWWMRPWRHQPAANQSSLSSSSTFSTSRRQPHHRHQLSLQQAAIEMPFGGWVMWVQGTMR